MTTAPWSIGEAARLTDVKVPTIRYYEQIGLLHAAPRTEGNRRYYREPDIRRLRFIRHARELGFEIDAIRTLLALQDHPQHPCDEVDALVGDHVANIDTKIIHLTALRRELQHMLDCCAGGRVAECRVIEAITAQPTGGVDVTAS
jgi:DNA-binding transcriptional MerR regulator